MTASRETWIKQAKNREGGGGYEGICEIISSNMCFAHGRSFQLNLNKKEKSLSCLLKLATGKAFFKVMELMELQSLKFLSGKAMKTRFSCQLGVFTSGPWAQRVTLSEPSLYCFTLQQDVREGQRCWLALWRLNTRQKMNTNITKDSSLIKNKRNTSGRNLSSCRFWVIKALLFKHMSVQTHQTQFNHEREL